MIGYSTTRLKQVVLSGQIPGAFKNTSGWQIPAKWVEAMKRSPHPDIRKGTHRHIKKNNRIIGTITPAPDNKGGYNLWKREQSKATTFPGNKHTLIKWFDTLEEALEKAKALL